MKRRNIYLLSMLMSVSIYCQAGLNHAPATEDLVSFELKFPAYGVEWEIPTRTITACREDGYYEEFFVNTWDEDWNSISPDNITVELPKGRYDFVTYFWRLNEEMMMGVEAPVFYICENVDVKEGGHAEFKPQESTICLKMESYNPDGEKSSFRKVYYSDEESEEAVIAEEGNIKEAYLIKMILLNGNPIETLSVNAGEVEIVASPDGTYPWGHFNAQDLCDFYVNKVSDRFSFREIRFMSARDEEDGSYLAVIDAPKGEAGTYSNNKEYRLDDSGIEASPSFTEYPPMPEFEGLDVTPYQITLFPYFNGEKFKMGESYSAETADLWKVYVSGPATPINSGDLICAYYKQLQDASLLMEEDGWEYVMAYYTDGPHQFPFAKEGETICVFPYDALNNAPNGGRRDMFPGNETFMTQLAQTEVETGGSAPLLTCYPGWEMDWDTGEKYIKPLYYYTGRLGERLGATAALAEESLQFNQLPVASDQNEVSNWYVENQETEGEMLLGISAGNFEIDGLKGGNTASIQYAKSANNDAGIPTFTMLQLRNKSGFVAQRFNSAADGEILLAAGVLKLVTPEDGNTSKAWCEAGRPTLVTAKSCPTGAPVQESEDIRLEEIVPDFISEAFGVSYRGGLETLNTPSPAGWYDLILTVSDEAGNKQTQRISPAFYVSGTDNVMAVQPDNQVIANGCNIQVPEGARVYDLWGNPVGTDSLAKGMYIVVTAGKTYKVIL